MLYRLPAHCDLPQCALYYLPHCSLSVQDRPCLLVLVYVYLQLVYQLLVHLLVLRYQRQQLVYLPVQLLVSVQTNEVLLSQFFLLRDNSIQFSLLCSNAGINSIQLVVEFLPSGHLIGQVV